jgi:CRISPR-associated protein Cas2
MIVIAAYDVSEDPRRARLATLLQATGDRVQRSVFVLSLDDTELRDLRERAAQIIDVDHDSLYYLFRQCGACWDVLDCLGQADPPQPVLYWAAP